jgi:hypothetical protein
VKDGLEFMAHRMVVDQIFTSTGVAYIAGEYAIIFFDSLTTEYARKLLARAEWVVKSFQDMSDVDLRQYMQSRWAHWGAEFVRESLFAEVDE